MQSGSSRISQCRALRPEKGQQSYPGLQNCLWQDTWSVPHFPELQIWVSINTFKKILTTPLFCRGIWPSVFCSILLPPADESMCEVYTISKQRMLLYQILHRNVLDFDNTSAGSCHGLKITLDLLVVCPLCLNDLCLPSFLRRIFGYAFAWERFIEKIGQSKDN